MERRKFFRVPAPEALPVRLFTSDLVAEGYVTDMNNAGAFVSTGLTLAQGARVALQFLVEEAEGLPRIPALVVRRSEEAVGERNVIPAGLGVAFLGTSREQKLLVQKLVLALLKKTDPDRRDDDPFPYGDGPLAA